ncbi:STAS-like domain-containing protein [Acinetobacter baumannii]|uniref:STAS-like domain-containing protein n=1 Tax=Acinetobacter baumannii TaxID=470 RepID=UPI001580C577|nr:STAS-like domain-containing protein [Acinetobacter baumannii]MDN8449656.1 STAS-like domain-containing protein [Acinetobacter baumannii]NUG32881.1 STAS-like domain-containing protein [Acinetobacter baumannii]
MSKSVMRINVAKDFSKNPSGRYIKDGKTSGEVFLKNVLLPAVKTHDMVEINFDGVRGYGSSFLEEAFGGFIRETKMSLVDFFKRVKIITQDPLLEQEIQGYLEDEVHRLSIS